MLLIKKQNNENKSIIVNHILYCTNIIKPQNHGTGIYFPSAPVRI